MCPSEMSTEATEPTGSGAGTLTPGCVDLNPSSATYSLGGLKQVNLPP